MHKHNSYLLSAAILEDWSSPRHFDYVGNVLEKKQRWKNSLITSKLWSKSEEFLPVFCF
jgi:hypothetical protein